MREFLADHRERTVPVVLYCATSGLLPFVRSLLLFLCLYGCFLVLSWLLTRSRAVVAVSVLVTCGVTGIYSALLIALSANSMETVLSKYVCMGLSLSMIFCTGVIVFLDLPTFEISRIAKFVFRADLPVCAVLSGFRCVPVIFSASQDALLALRLRGLHRKGLLSVTLFLENVTINFLEFIADFGLQVSRLDLRALAHGATYASWTHVWSYVYVVLAVAGVVL